MVIAAIIAEYNPFHAGHAYHIDETRRRTGADTVIAIMSGGFTERGEPAVLDKYTRAALAVRCGADAVIELPCLYALSSAKYFAEGAVRTLMNVKNVGYLSFGSESGDIDELQAHIAAVGSAEYAEVLKNRLKAGKSYAAANEEAYKSLKIGTSYTAATPNNILAIEYLRALGNAGSQIVPVTIKRKGSDYHSAELSASPSSAAVRSLMNTAAPDELLNLLKGRVPDCVAEALQNPPKIDTNRLYAIIAARLSESSRQITDYYEDNEGIINRMTKACLKARDYDELIDMTHTKRYSKSRIRRIALHVALQQSAALALAPADYARVLAIKRDRLDILSSVRNQPTESPLFLNDIYADRIYEIITSEKMPRGMIIVD